MGKLADAPKGKEACEQHAKEPKGAAAKRWKKRLKPVIAAAVVVALAAAAVAVYTRDIVPSRQRAATVGVFGSAVDVGDTIALGEYEQDGKTGNGKEPIEWRVLAFSGNEMLLVSCQVLDCRQFNADASGEIDWDASTLKAWLEGEFTNAAFSSDEKALLSGAPFCLSDGEISEYFENDADRECKPTAYAVSQGVWSNNDNGCSHWWLRSPGHYPNYALYVFSSGDLNSFGCSVDHANIGVRPALWINLEP